ncbi:MAG: glycerophosphodiester phosphodiesterase family protein [Planctomycetota bacterium]|nr:glycerophosphodiester phosphodiesterase family protein [Planctomycetota bacterium]
MNHTNARRSGCPVEIVAHRGASAEAPENTLASVQLAWQLEADAVEIDVQLSRDGRLAVIHDADLQRTGGCNHRVIDLSMAELRTFDVGAWKGEQWQGEMVADLPDILATVPVERRLYVELKCELDSGSPSQIVDALERALSTAESKPDSVVLISFDMNLLAAAKRRLPEFSAFLVAEQSFRENQVGGTTTGTGNWEPSIDCLIESAVSAGFDGVDLSNTEAITAAAMAQVTHAHLASCVWTVNSIEDARRLVLAGVESLTTDDPRTLRAALSGSAGQ